MIKYIVMYMSSNKQKIINDIYYDRSGFGSRATTLKDAREKDKSITKENVEKFFKKNVEEKRRPRGENSFVAPHAYFEFQLDLFFISKHDVENQKFSIGMVLIDIFSKYATVIPIKSKGSTGHNSGDNGRDTKNGRKTEDVLRRRRTEFV